MIRVCPHCGKQNRVPAEHLADTGRCGACRKALPPLAQPLDVDAATFTEIIGAADVPVLVDFWAPWCGPCKMAAPVVAAAAASLAGRAIVIKLNTEENPSLAAEYAVRSIPLFAVFRDGALQWQQAGLLRQAQLEQAVLERA